jgi:hypothetical protein
MEVVLQLVKGLLRAQRPLNEHQRFDGYQHWFSAFQTPKHDVPEDAPEYVHLAIDKARQLNISRSIRSESSAM